ncbi:hypothetical protein IU449_27740 [Nocardia higoensis]|uniref:Uncharacterized protein n=1 Tax=Nocardia higoensis TaxID=228599 RepID=A0ABS0DJF9_9NOCA|nr:hypothetical protein [Nocardia higoensis]MBF6358295.1 hypothetical protein [Nocardia higoensis]
MSTDLHLIYTKAGEGGWTIQSPQIPELIGGRKTAEDLLQDTPAIIEFAKDPDQHFDRMFAHEQHWIEDPAGDEYLIRWCISDEAGPVDERYQTAGRLNAAVHDGYESEEKARQPQSVTGERLLLVVLPSDTLGWITDQLGPSGCAVLCHHEGEGAIWSLPIGSTGMDRQQRWGFERLGLTPQSTFAEMLDAVMSSETTELTRIVEPASEPIARGMPPSP